MVQGDDLEEGKRLIVSLISIVIYLDPGKLLPLLATLLGAEEEP